MRLVLQCGRRGPEKSQNKQKKETWNNKSPEIIHRHKNMQKKETWNPKPHPNPTPQSRFGAAGGVSLCGTLPLTGAK